MTLAAITGVVEDHEEGVAVGAEEAGEIVVDVVAVVDAVDVDAVEEVDLIPLEGRLWIRLI
jgi:hypothetical protein